MAPDDFVCAFHLFLCANFACRVSTLSPCTSLSHLLLVPIPGYFHLGFLGHIRWLFSFLFISHRSDSSMSVATMSLIQILVSCGTSGGTTFLTFVCSFVSTDANELSTAPHWTRAPSSLILRSTASSRGLCHLLTLSSLPLPGPLLQHPSVLLTSNPHVIYHAPACSSSCSQCDCGFPPSRPFCQLLLSAVVNLPFAGCFLF